MAGLWRGSTLQKIRLVSGLILFVFAAAHFVNHALGLVSLEAMNRFDAWRIGLVRSLPGLVVLTAALGLHIVLTLAKVIRRRTLRMQAWEAMQIGMGLAIPLLLFPHIVNTHVAHALFGVQDTYLYEIAHLWPNDIAWQTVLMLLVWVHGCMGLHYWLRLSPLYQRLTPVLLALAVLLPFAAFTGISVQGQAWTVASSDPERVAGLKSETHWPEGETAARIIRLRRGSVSAFAMVLAVAAALSGARLLLQRRAKRIAVRYVGGATVAIEPGLSLLEVSRRHAIPHMAVCGGRGRCSTCRVHVLEGAENLEPPSALEAATLAAIQAAPHVRLACQARPTGPITVLPLLKPDVASALLPNPVTEAQPPVERDLAVLFVDMRGFTAMTESKLAFDVVFILNQFFSTVGKPIYDFGGWITNYSGDGLIALFGDPEGIGGACRAALLAAVEIDAGIGALNNRLGAEMQQPIQIAMGLHAGPHVIGRIGYLDAQSQSVIGLAVNVASRMETLAKLAGVQLAASKTAADHGGLDTRGLRVETTDVRGLAQPIGVVFIDRAREIGTRLRPQDRPQSSNTNGPRPASR